jgi:hypothetical protein
MDQNILPGVGNIIKCEGLFKSSISPNSKSNKIPTEKLFMLVGKLREFAAAWYIATKKGGKGNSLFRNFPFNPCNSSFLALFSKISIRRYMGWIRARLACAQ